MSHSTSKILGNLADSFLTPERIRSARRKCGLTKTELARKMQLTAKTIAKYERDGAPLGQASKLADVLGFPESYFSQDPLLPPSLEEVNFRAGRRANVRERSSAVETAPFGEILMKWVEQRFKLPALNLQEFQDESPRVAARLLRTAWGLGTKPLPNLVQLCESKGIYVLGLPVLAESVDAYSTWRSDKPYIYIARRKTPERTRFDVAHELGHLVLHSLDMSLDEQNIESQANEFASEFLVPEDSIVEHLPLNPSVDQVIEVKNHFKISAMALVYAARHAGRMTEWSYRQSCIELTQRGFRTGEPGGMREHETSRVFSYVLNPQRRPAITVKMIADELSLPESDVHALTFGIELRAVHHREVQVNREAPAQSASDGRPHLQLIR